MTYRTVVYYWSRSTAFNGWYYIEVDYDNKLYSVGKTSSRENFSSNCYLHGLPRYRDIKRHEQVLKDVGFKQIETFRGY